MVGLAVLGLAFVFFVVVAFFAAKTWHVGHIVALVFLFLGTLVFLFLTATLFRTQQKFHPAYQKSVEDLAREEQTNRRLRYSDGATPADPSSLQGIQLLARVEQFDRGRVWRNLRRVPGEGFTLNTAFWNNDGCLRVGEEPESGVDALEPVPDEALSGDATDTADGADGADAAATDAAEAVAVAPAGPVNPHGITADQFVYAFKEYPIAQFLTPVEKEYYFGGLGGETNFADQDTRGLCRVPMVYLGQFRVMNVAEQTITLLPEIPLDQAQAQRANDPRDPGTWVLYEHLPLDSSDAFKDLTAEQLAGLMPFQRLRQMGVPISQQAYDATLAELMGDGKEVDERSVHPDRVEMEIEFLRPHEVVVDFEVEGELPETDQPFTPDGRARVKHLMQGESTKFEVGQTGRFDLLTAQDWVSQGIAKPVRTFYRRQVRDFEFAFKDHAARMADLQDEINVVQQDYETLQAAIVRLQEQIAQRRTEIELLTSDLNGFDFEQQQLRKFAAELQQNYQRLQRSIQSERASQQPVLASPLAAQ